MQHKVIHFLFNLQHPWMVGVTDSDGILHCGGSVAASDKIITAAHCFMDPKLKTEMTKEKKQSFKVIAGAINPFEFHGK